MSASLMNRFKIFAAAFLAVICIFAFAACGDKYEGSAYTGEWKCASAQMEGIKISADKVVSDFFITLDADGKATAVIDGNKSGGRWEKTDKGIEITSGDKKLEFQSRDDNIVYSDSGMEIIFKKVK